jgi:hypothetical protein
MHDLFEKEEEVNGISYAFSTKQFTFTFSDAGIGFGSLLVMGRFNGVNSNIIPEHFPELDTIVDDSENYYYQLLRPTGGGEFSQNKITKLFKNLSVEPTSARELLCIFASLTKKQQKKILEFDVVALASHWRDTTNEDMGMRIPFIGMKKGERKLRLSHEATFTNHDIFLVKRLRPNLAKYDTSL